MFDIDTLVLLRNSARDGRKGDKLVSRWPGPYQIYQNVGKGVYRLQNIVSQKILILKKRITHAGKSYEYEFM